MRTLFVCSLALSSAALFAADAAAPAAAPAPAASEPAVFDAPPPPPVPLTPEQEKQAFALQGFFFAKQTQLGAIVTELGMTDAEIEAMLQGIRLSLKNEQLPFDVQSVAGGADAFFSGRAAAKQQLWTKSNADFLAKVDADTTVTKTTSGLRYKIVEPGTAEKPNATSKVSAKYTGRLVDGKVFDTTDNRGGQPSDFGLNQVIKGWTEGLQLIGKGGKIRLWVPADIGYGAQGNGTIPGGSVLEFDVELVDFK